MKCLEIKLIHYKLVLAWNVGPVVKPLVDYEYQ